MMKRVGGCFLFTAIFLLSQPCLAVDPDLDDKIQDRDENNARTYLEYLNTEHSKWANRLVLADWAYTTNIKNEQAKKNKAEVSLEYAKWEKRQWQDTISYPWKSYRDQQVQRQFQKYAVLGTSALSDEKYLKYENLITGMVTTYSSAKICDYNNASNCQQDLDPDLTNVLAHSRNPDELRHVWVEWRRATGEQVRSSFEHYVALSNEAARLNNFTDTSVEWLRDYESDNFTDQVLALWEQVRPLYEQIHAYMRRQLRGHYGDKLVTSRGPIPAHLLGNMWAQTWNNIADLGMPYPKQQAVDVTPQMVDQGYTPLRMFRLSEEFFTSLNLSAMPETFWNNSVIEKPPDREIVCHASAWDFSDGKDFRIKQCTRVDMDDLFTVHHEMGHVQYFLQYKHQPSIFREGANPGFHEAIGDVISLSVSTPKHLRRIGLLDQTDNADNQEATINYLYSQALQKVVFLPYALLLDRWRWDVFKGVIASNDYNCKYWQMREQLQGLEPPVDRTEEDFDPGAKYHIVDSVPYIRYFVSFVIQFQFHRALCERAGQFDPNDAQKPLHQCDIYQSTEAGNLLKEMLQLGSSKAWPDAMEILTGQRNMDASGVLDYFRPLQQWLEAENKRTGEFIGWEKTKRVCSKHRPEPTEI